jgi:hypothetical protein
LNLWSCSNFLTAAKHMKSLCERPRLSTTSSPWSSAHSGHCRW